MVGEIYLGYYYCGIRVYFIPYQIGITRSTRNSVRKKANTCRHRRGGVTVFRGGACTYWRAPQVPTLPTTAPRTTDKPRNRPTVHHGGAEFRLRKSGPTRPGQAEAYFNQVAQSSVHVSSRPDYARHLLQSIRLSRHHERRLRTFDVDMEFFGHLICSDDCHSEQLYSTRLDLIKR